MPCPRGGMTSTAISLLWTRAVRVVSLAAPPPSPQSELCSVMLHAHSLRNVIGMLSLVVQRSLRFSGLACSQALSSVVVLFGYTRQSAWVGLQRGIVFFSGSVWLHRAQTGRIKCSIKCMDRLVARHCLLFSFCLVTQGTNREDKM